MFVYILTYCSNFIRIIRLVYNCAQGILLSSCRIFAVAFVTCVIFAASNSLRLVCFDRCHRCLTRLSIAYPSPLPPSLSVTPPLSSPFYHLFTPVYFADRHTSA